LTEKIDRNFRLPFFPYNGPKSYTAKKSLPFHAHNQTQISPISSFLGRLLALLDLAAPLRHQPIQQPALHAPAAAAAAAAASARQQTGRRPLPRLPPLRQLTGPGHLLHGLRQRRAGQRLLRQGLGRRGPRPTVQEEREQQ